MKTFTFLLLVWLGLLPAVAQKKVEKTFPYTASREVYLNLKYASDIRVKVWDKNEIFVNATVNINDNTNNDNFELELKPSDARTEIKATIRNLKEIARQPGVNQTNKSGSYYGDGGYWDCDNHVYINTGAQVYVDIDYEIYVPAQANVSLKTISGNVFSDYQKGKYTLETISGKIDLRLPAAARCDLGVKTISGDVYTDLTFEKPKPDADGLSRVGGKYEADLRLNGGGDALTLKTISGNIYLRKK